jgi:pentalenene oxygenase
MTDKIGELTNSWEDGKVIAVRTEMRTFTSRVAAATMFAARMSEADQQQALQDLSTLLAGTYKRMFLPAYLTRIPTPGNRMYGRARMRFRRVLGELISDYRRTGADHGDALSMLLAAHTDGTPRLTDAEITDQVVILFVGGSDTTANALSWALYNLARHPDAERRLHAEVDTVLSGSAATLEDLERLTFTSQVVTETLRLYPPTPMVTRTVTADTDLGGYPISAGTTLVYSPLTVHHRSDLFADPEQFNPDRWTAPHLAGLPRGAFTPFGGGARKCIGDSFGMTMATLAVATIAARWRLELPPDANVRPILRTFLAPRDLRMTLRARQRSRKRC